MEDFLYIGRVANTHGVRGMIKVLPTTDDPKRFELLEEITLENSKGIDQVYKIEVIKYLKQFVLLQLEGIDDMDAAMALKQSIIKIPRDLALPLEEDEFYISDIIGLETYNDEGKYIGPCKDVIFTGSNDVYVIDNGSKNGLLLPAIKECVLDINIEENKMIVKVLAGLEEL